MTTSKFAAAGIGLALIWLITKAIQRNSLSQIYNTNNCYRAIKVSNFLGRLLIVVLLTAAEPAGLPRPPSSWSRLPSCALTCARTWPRTEASCFRNDDQRGTTKDAEAGAARQLALGTGDWRRGFRVELLPKYSRPPGWYLAAETASRWLYCHPLRPAARAGRASNDEGHFSA